jgi:hypothetical protein
MLQGKLKNILYKLIFPKQNKNYKQNQNQIQNKYNIVIYINSFFEFHLILAIRTDERTLTITHTVITYSIILTSVPTI